MPNKKLKENNIILNDTKKIIKESARVKNKLDKSFLQNSIFEGDCLNVMSRFPPKSIDLVLCDLPYGTTQNKWDSVIDLHLLWKEYKRIIKPNGAIILTSQGVFTAKLILSNESWFYTKWFGKSPSLQTSLIQKNSR